MIKTLKVQVTAYKWIIIICMISLLTLGLGWQYHRASTLEIQAGQLAEDNAEINKKLVGVVEQFNTYKANTDKALADLALLREELTIINDTTSKLQTRVDAFKMSKPAIGGSNSKEIEKEINIITEDLFKRIEDASKDKSK